MRTWIIPFALLVTMTAPAAEMDRPLAVRSRTETAAAPFRSQILGSLDRAVGSGINLGVRTIAARPGDKGSLELDLAGDGKWRTITRPGPIQVVLSKPGTKPNSTDKVTFTLHLDVDATKSWTYRNNTVVVLGIGPDQVVLVDVNGNGAYNDAGIDGCAWLGDDRLWPLPGSDERWCTKSAEVAGLTIGAWGEDAKATGRSLATTLPATLPLLRNIHDERRKLGLTPRPEDAKLAADLQKHCDYMSTNDQLTHPEDKGKSGYTPEGHAAGMRSIISMGTPAESIASMMVTTFYHRQDVIRPLTAGFGVGFQGKYGGIDGRTNMLKGRKVTWPLLCPDVEQVDVPTRFSPESPDPVGGDKDAGFPITAYFDGKAQRLTSSRLSLVVNGQAGPPVDCYTFDSTTGGDVSMNKYQKVVALIAKEPLKDAAVYEVAMTVDDGGTTWSKTWRFATVGAAKRRR
jgi:hypothetical protein